MAFDFCMGVCGLLMRNYESTVAPMVLAVVPGLGVLMMVFYLYPKEFFACGIVGGLGLLGLWVYRTLSSGTIYYAYLILTVVIAAAGAVLAWKLKKAGGGVEGQEPQLDPAAVGCSLPAVLPYSSHYPGSAPASSGCGVPWATMAFGQWQLGCSSWRSTSRQNSCKSKESTLLTPCLGVLLPFHLCGASLGQGVFCGQHGIGVILFCRKGLHGEGLGGVSRGVQVSQQEIWAQPGGLAVAVPPSAARIRSLAEVPAVRKG